MFFFYLFFFHSKGVNNVDYRGRNFLGMSLTVYIHDIYIRLHWKSPLQHPSRVCSSKKSHRVSAHTRRTLSRGGRTSKYHGHIIYFLFASSILIHHHHQLHFFFFIPFLCKHTMPRIISSFSITLSSSSRAIIISNCVCEWNIQKKKRRMM